jgi:hypothetical protein
MTGTMSPAPATGKHEKTKHGSRPRTVDVREVLNAVFYALSTGCQWSALEHGLGLLLALGVGRDHRAHPPCPLRCGARVCGTRGQPDHDDHRQPDGEGSAKEGATLDPSGYDAGKKVIGRKRHLLTDTIGMLLCPIRRRAIAASCRWVIESERTASPQAHPRTDLIRPTTAAPW